jgi:hypothetical protein
LPFVGQLVDRALTRVRAEALAEVGIAQQPLERTAGRRDVTRVDDEARLAVDDGLV